MYLSFFEILTLISIAFVLLGIAFTMIYFPAIGKVEGTGAGALYLFSVVPASLGLVVLGLTLANLSGFGNKIGLAK